MKQSGTEKKTGRWRFSLRFQIVSLLLLCYLLPSLSLGLFSRFVLLQGLQDRVEAALRSDTAYTWTMTVQNLDRVVSLGKEAVYDEDLSNFWGQWRTSAISNAEFLRLSRNYLERKFGRDSLFSFAALIPAGSENLMISNPSGRNAASAFLNSCLSAALTEAEILDTGNLFMGDGEQLYLVRNLLNLRMERTGILVLGLNREVLLKPIFTLQDRWNAGMTLQLDRYEEGHADWESLEEGLTDLPGIKLIRFVRMTDAESGYSLKLMLTLDREEHYRELYSFQRLSGFILLLLIPVLLLILLFVRTRIVRPIGLLADASRRIEAGELGVTVPMRGGDELGNLGVAFSGMSTRLKELIQKTYQEEIALKNAQIQALQSRINPHFLNNALETINWEARMEGSENISHMISALSVLLNATLSRQNRRLVPLQEELEVADSYIYFIQLRFEDSLSVLQDIDPSAADCFIPLLTVQPVLENAVEHGIAPAGGGEIRLIIRKEEKMLRIRILNTGRPIRPEDQARIDRALSGTEEEGNHLGLSNIAHRLRLLYGSRADITAGSGPEGETVVELQIPQDIKEKEEKS